MGGAAHPPSPSADRDVVDYTGRAVRRIEDFALVSGRAAFSGDCVALDHAHAVVLRSAHAYARLNKIETTVARAMPGVLAIYTAADLVAYQAQKSLFSIKSIDGGLMRGNGTQFFATDKLRYVGDPIALIVADSESTARDAAEAIGLDIDSLQAVTDARAADGAPIEPIYETAPGNVCALSQDGDPAKIDAVFATAAHVTRLHVLSNRVVVSAMEPRAALVAYEPEDGRFTFHMQSQGVVGMRNALAASLGVAPESVRVLTGQVGGSFGMKGVVFPEYLALAHAARAIGRPIKWTDTRTESFVSDHQGRDHDLDAELALDQDGRIQALRITGYGNLGAYMSPFGVMIAALNIHRNAQSVYQTPLVGMTMKTMFTNTPPIGAYRGAGRPEGNYIMERLIETAAREMGIDALDLRRRNHIPADTLPFKTPVGTVYDSGDFTGLMDAAVAASDWDGYAARKDDSHRRGRLRGRGLGQYLEVTAPPMRELGEICFDEDGHVTLLTGTLDFGQGHATTFAQIVADKLGLPFHRIKLVQGDSDRLRAGGGTGGSKSTMASGAALVEAGERVIEKARQAAAYFLETAPGDIEFDRGTLRVVGTDRAIALLDLAARLKAAGPTLPDGAPHALDVSHVHELSPSAYPNGCHVAEVEIDPDTGVVEVVRYTMTNDFGVVINPMIVEGQTHGGVVQAIGQALMERTCFDAEGQFLTGSYADYAMPRADNAPNFTLYDRPTRATTNPLGAKGCGEAGCAGGLPAIMNALVDALTPYGVTHVNMPATPETVWRLIHKA